MSCVISDGAVIVFWYIFDALKQESNFNCLLLLDKCIYLGKENLIVDLTIYYNY